MPAGVVDLLEIVQIDEQQRPHLPRLARRGQGMVQAVQQHASVGQAGQPVKVGQLVRAGFGQLAFGDVSRQGNETGNLPGRCAFLVRDGQLEPMRLLRQFQSVLVAH